MKTIVTNPDILTRAQELATAHPGEAFTILVVVLGAICWKLKDAI